VTAVRREQQSCSGGNAEYGSVITGFVTGEQRADDRDGVSDGRQQLPAVVCGEAIRRR
jgi:hypothetical protein